MGTISFLVEPVLHEKFDGEQRYDIIAAVFQKGEDRSNHLVIVQRLIRWGRTSRMEAPLFMNFYIHRPTFSKMHFSQNRSEDLAHTAKTAIYDVTKVPQH